MVDDLLEPERAIVKRLKDKIKSVSVLRASDSRDILQGNKPQITPAILVLSGGADATLNGSVVTIVLRFVLVIATRNVSDVRNGGAARDEAGPLAPQVIEVIQGWRPCSGFGDLLLTNIDSPLLSEGYFLLPLIFTTNTLASGENHYG